MLWTWYMGLLSKRLTWVLHGAYNLMFTFANWVLDSTGCVPRIRPKLEVRSQVTDLSASCLRHVFDPVWTIKPWWIAPLLWPTPDFHKWRTKTHFLQHQAIPWISCSVQNQLWKYCKPLRMNQKLQVQIWMGETDLINTVDIVFISRVD